jgi:hypothetical protein
MVVSGVDQFCGSATEFFTHPIGGCHNVSPAMIHRLAAETVIWRIAAKVSASIQDAVNQRFTVFWYSFHGRTSA